MKVYPYFLSGTFLVGFCTIYSLASVGEIQAQEATNVVPPEPGNAISNSPGQTSDSRFQSPSPDTPQPPGINATNIPDGPPAAPSEPTPAVSQAVDHVEQGDWVAYGHDATGQKYSPLKQITTENVTRLQKAFVYHTGSLPRPGQQNKWAAETTPIKVGDGLYMCSAMNDMMKLDPATGKELWRYQAGVKYESIPYTAACKGVVYYTSSTIPQGQPCHNRILEGTLDMRLIEVDADSGKLCDGFGYHGQVNLMKGMGYSVPGYVSVTSPPPIVNGAIITNHEVLDGQRRWAPSGVIRGYDAETGRFLWAWDVKKPNNHGEPLEGQYYSRGTPNSWSIMTGDNELGQVYIPMGSAAADYYSAMRSPEENAVSTSIVALDVKTGTPRWVFQTVHKDVWDYDIGSQPIMIDLPQGDHTVSAIFIPGKRGQNFIVDRRTGKPLSRVVERPVPTDTDVPGDERSPTQPYSPDVPAFEVTRDLKETDMWGMSPIDQLYCRLKFRQAHYEGEFTPPQIHKPYIEYPGYDGGSDWGSIAYDSTTGILVGNWNNTPMYDQVITRKKANELGLMAVDNPNYRPDPSASEGNGPQADTPVGISVSPFLNKYTGMMCNAPPYGMLTAVDMHSRKVLWQVPFGSARANGPWGLATHLPLTIGVPLNGGPIITAGGLIFVASTTDNLIHAYNLKTGKEIWNDVLPGGGQATPMTYEYNGNQYVAIMAGGHHFMQTPVSDDLVVYALPH